MPGSLSRQLPPPETPRLDTEGELAAALHELEGLGRLRSASVMGLLPTPRDYAAREAARHCRSLADHLLDADPMARTGQAFWVADLAREYGFTDIDGTIPDAEKLHEQLLKSAPAFWREVLGSDGGA